MTESIFVDDEEDLIAKQLAMKPQMAKKKKSKKLGVFAGLSFVLVDNEDDLEFRKLIESNEGKVLSKEAVGKDALNVLYVIRSENSEINVNILPQKAFCVGEAFIRDSVERGRLRDRDDYRIEIIKRDETKLPYSMDEDKFLVIHVVENMLLCQLLTEKQLFRKLSNEAFRNRSAESLEGRWKEHLLPLLLKRGFAAMGISFEDFGFDSQEQMDRFVDIRDGQLRVGTKKDQLEKSGGGFNINETPHVFRGGEGTSDPDLEFAKRLELLANATNTSKSHAIRSLFACNGNWGIARRHLQHSYSVRNQMFNERDDALIMDWIQRTDEREFKYCRTFSEETLKPVDELDHEYATFEEMQKVRGRQFVQSRVEFLRELDNQLEMRLVNEK